VTTERAAGAAGELVDALKTAIGDGTYVPGQRLPPERALSETFGVSRPTVREALQALAAMNLIELRRGSGAYVTDLRVFDLLEPVRFAIELNEPTLASLFEIRGALEPIAARRAAERRTQGEARGLRRIADAASAPGVDDERFVELDVDLHEAIVSASRDDLLRTILSSLSVLLYASRIRSMEKAGVRELTLRDHTAIVAAIDAGRGEDAAAAMRAHLEHTRDAVLPPG
jgi:GntR family transcriptional repressor for pyruvate dehydrogenase complex